MNRRASLDALNVQPTPRRDNLKALAGMMEGLPDPVIAVDAEGFIIQMNPAAACFTSWAGSAADRQHISEQLCFRDELYMAPGKRTGSFMARLLDACSQGPVEVVRLARPDRALSAHAVPVHGAAGEPLGAVVQLRDETAPALLRDARKMLQLVMDNIPQFIFWKDTNSVYLGCNKNFARVAGFERPEDIVGKTDHDLPWRREEADAFLACDRRVISTNTPEYHLLETQLQADGKQARVDTNKIPLRAANGSVVGILGTYEDITERLQLEEQLRHAQKMDAMGRLAGGVAHDFNNMLTAIMGYTDLTLSILPPDGQALGNLEEVLKVSQRAAELTQQLLTFSRKRQVQPRSMAVDKLILGIDRMLRRLIREDTELVSLLSSTGKIRMDPGELEQVIVNLVVNGSQAMPGGGKLTIETCDLAIDPAVDPIIDAQGNHPYKDTSPGQYVRIRIRDTGIGMTEEVKKHIFEPFFTTKAPGQGTGLGLAIVYGIIHRASGAIHLDSAPGKGTTFDILLPCAAGDEVAEPAETPRKDRPRGSETVLVVEDDVSVRRLLVHALRELGYTVIETANGEEALRAVGKRQDRPIDLVFTDMVMPVMGGLELVARLRAMQPDLDVIFTSGYTGTAGVDSFLGQGTGFLEKPFTLDALARKIREVLDYDRPGEPMRV